MPSFSKDLAASRASEAARAHISTVKLVTKLLGAVITNPGLAADEKLRGDTLRSLHAQALTFGEALAQQSLGRMTPDWLRSQCIHAGADAICQAWEGGLAQKQIQAFDARMANQIGDIAREGEAIAGRVGFDGYVVADSIETAQARLYVSVTAAIGRLCVFGVDPKRAAASVGEIVDQLEATPAFAGLQLDLRTAWMQGSLGRCVDHMASMLTTMNFQAEAQPHEDRLAFAQRQALSLTQEVENYAQSLIQRKFGEADRHAEGPEADPGAVPRAG